MPSAKKESAIRFHHLTKASFPHRGRIKAIVARLLKDAGLRPEAISYIFCSDQYLRNINKEYLNHDYFTDIITFDLSEPGGGITADIYISVDRVRENARTFKVPFIRELLRVIFHGALHLSGYKDKTAGDQQLMREKEDYYLQKHGSTVPRKTVS